MSVHSADMEHHKHTKTNRAQLWFSEVLFIVGQYKHAHTITQTDAHAHIHFVTLKLGQCEPAKALLRWEERKER